MSRAPLIPWPELRSRLAAEWKPGEHVTLIGPTRSGKTHLALELAEMCSHVFVLATKRRDPLIAELRERDYLVTGNVREVLWTERGPLHRKVCFWPQFSEKLSAAARMKAQKQAMASAIAWAEQTGGWLLLIDETMWMTENLKLDAELKSLWFQGRSLGISVIACAQRPTHVPRLAFSSADYLFLAQTADRRDVDNLREISGGIPKEVIEESVRSLDFDAHEFLFIDTHRRELARTVAPAR